MPAMANQAYLNVWCKDFPEDRIIERFGAFLATVPFSATRPGFTNLTFGQWTSRNRPCSSWTCARCRSMPGESSKLRGTMFTADCSFETGAYWDLALFDAGTGKSKIEPQTLEIFCRGEDYDDGFWRQNGHFEVNLGFEHFFTGHGRLLGIRRGPSAPARESRRSALSGGHGLAGQSGEIPGKHARKYSQAARVDGANRRSHSRGAGAAVVRGRRKLRSAAGRNCRGSLAPDALGRRWTRQDAVRTRSSRMEPKRYILSPTPKNGEAKPMHPASKI